MNKLFSLPAVVLGTVSLSFSMGLCAAQSPNNSVRSVAVGTTNVVKGVGYGVVGVANGAGQAVGTVFKTSVDATTGLTRNIVK